MPLARDRATSETGASAEGRHTMNNDKYFSIYCFVMLGGVAAIVTASVQAGYGSLPSPLVFIEHIVMSLVVRAAYKSFGWDWGLWTFGFGARPEDTLEPSTAIAGLPTTSDIDDIAAA